MRVGELLVRNRWIDERTLASTLLEHPNTGMRLCSMLAQRGLVTFDQASHVLGEQRGVASLLRRHLHHRDREVAALIPEAFARARVVLPIGRLGGGALIVCARDPSRALHADVARIVHGEIVMAVAPATYLERAIEEAFDFEIPIDVQMPMRARGVPEIAVRGGTRDALETLLASLPDIDELGWIIEELGGYLEQHWDSWILLEVREARRAVGVAGRGAKLSPKTLRTLVLDVSESNFLRAAYEARTFDEPVGELDADDAQLVAALDGNAPVIVAIGTPGEISHMIVCAGAGDRQDASIDLQLLADALGTVLARLSSAAP